MRELKVGDVIVQQFGPYEAKATVIEIKPQGAVLEYEFLAHLEGFPEAISAPDGTPLTADRAHGFLGRAHWDAAEVVQ